MKRGMGAPGVFSALYPRRLLSAQVGDPGDTRPVRPRPLSNANPRLDSFLASGLGKIVCRNPKQPALQIMLSCRASRQGCIAGKATLKYPLSVWGGRALSRCGGLPANNEMIPNNIHIVGGASGIGRWLIDHVLRSSSGVFCYDVDKINLARLPEHVTPCLISDFEAYVEHEGNFSDGDIVVIAVPPDHFRKSLSDVLKCVKPGSLLVACNSVQVPAVADLREQTPEHSYFMGCHPLFAPTLRMPDGFTVILTEHDETPIKKKLATLISDAGLSIVSLPAEEHDRYMAIVQSLTHFCLLTFCKTIAESDLDLSKLKNVRTPNFQFLYAFGSRILRLSASTTAAIQMEKIASETRERFLSAANSLHVEISQCSMPEATKLINKLASDFKREHFEEGGSISDAAVDAIQRFENVLRQHKDADTAFIFRHAETKQLRFVKIKQINTDEILVVEAAAQIGDKLAVNFDEIAVQNYKRMGIYFQTGAPAVLKKRHIQLISQKELQTIRSSVALPIRMSYYFENPNHRNKEFFEYWLPQAVPGLLNCTILDYISKTAPGRVHLAFEFRPETRRSEIISLVNTLLNKRKLMSSVRARKSKI